MKTKGKDLFNYQPAPRDRKRNGFNMSYHSYFTCKPGMIVPNYIQEVRGGDYLEVTPSNFTRTQPMQTSAFTQIREYTDFFFVPYRLLWKWWPQFEAQLDNQISSYQPATGDSWSVPIIDIDAFRDWIKSSSSTAELYNPLVRMLDMLDIASLKDYESNDQVSKDVASIPAFNIFRPAAYQCIWSRYYRNSYWTPLYVDLFNFDNVGIGGKIVNRFIKDSYSLYHGLFEVRYAPWYKDSITGVIPTNMLKSLTSGPNGGNGSYGIFSQPNVVRADDNNHLSVVGSGTDNNTDNTGYSFFDTVNNTSVGLGYVSANAGSAAQNGDFVNVTAETIRMALAFDNYCRKRAMANKDIIGQISAVMGEKEEASRYMPLFLGSFSSDVNIGEVTATSSGSDGSNSSNVLGQIAGKGIASRQGDTIKFTAKEDGIVMGMHYIIPTSQLSGTTDPFNLKYSLFDYYSPEFDGLGMQAQPTYLLGSSRSDPGNFADVFGFAPRYCEYKSRLNVVHNDLGIGRSLASWCSPRPFLQSPSVENWMYVRPDSLDTIFGVKSDNSCNTDQFICHFRFDANKASDMSRLGVDFTY